MGRVGTARASHGPPLRKETPVKHAPVVAVLCVVCAMPGAAQSITVTKPVADATCTNGQPCAIAWTVSGRPSGKVILELMDKVTPRVIRQIASNLPTGDLRYPWTVPGDIPDGQYRVRVRVARTTSSAVGGVFTIQARSGGLHAVGMQVAAPVAPIRISEPAHTSVWTIDETHTIRWQANDSVKYPLWLFLEQQGHATKAADRVLLRNVAVAPCCLALCAGDADE